MPGIVQLEGSNVGEKLFGMAMAMVGAKESQQRLELQRQALLLQKDQFEMEKVYKAQQQNLALRGMSLAENQFAQSQIVYQEGADLRNEQLRASRQANDANALAFSEAQLTSADRVEASKIAVKRADAEADSARMDSHLKAIGVQVAGRTKDYQVQAAEWEADRMRMLAHKMAQDIRLSAEQENRASQLHEQSLKSLKLANELNDPESEKSKELMKQASEAFAALDRTAGLNTGQIKALGQASVLSTVVPGMRPLLESHLQASAVNVQLAQRNRFMATNNLLENWMEGSVGPGSFDPDTAAFILKDLQAMADQGMTQPWVPTFWEKKIQFPKKQTTRSGNALLDMQNQAVLSGDMETALFLDGKISKTDAMGLENPEYKRILNKVLSSGTGTMTKTGDELNSEVDNFKKKTAAQVGQYGR